MVSREIESIEYFDMNTKDDMSKNSLQYIDFFHFDETIPPQKTISLKDSTVQGKRGVSDDILHVVSVVFSPFGQATRFRLGQEYIDRMTETEKTQPMQLYVIELLYENQKSELKKEKNHITITVPDDYILWNKENLINIVIQKFLPTDWKYCAWIDADIEFLDSQWVEKTLQRFKETNAEFLQLFSFCRYLDKENQVSQYFKSTMYGYLNGIKNTYLHPGFAWGCTRSAYEKINGLFEYGIVGGGDKFLSQSLLRRIPYMSHVHLSPSLTKKLHDFHKSIHRSTANYVNVIIQHHYHGERKNRQYTFRQRILTKYQFDPNQHLFRDPDLGLLIPNFPEKMQHDVQKYFQTRKERED